MERKEFLAQGFSVLGLFAFGNAVTNCKADAVPSDNVGSDEAGTTASGDCVVSSDETAGPFPTKKPEELMVADITGDREGTTLTIKINVLDAGNNCNPLEGALVDIWHCDAGGNYSEYGGTGMQSANFTSVHFLRGRQTTDQNGLVTFKSIYPGWYRGRAPHIHVHIFDSKGKSLKITQIAFPEPVSKVVYAQGVYAVHGQADTSNSLDSVFRDGIATNMSVVDGTITEGYELQWNGVVES